LIVAASGAHVVDRCGPVRNLVTSRPSVSVIPDSECLVLPVVAVAVVDDNNKTTKGEIT